MPAVAQTMQLTAGQLVMWAAVLMAAVAVTVHLLRRDLALQRVTGGSAASGESAQSGAAQSGATAHGFRPGGHGEGHSTQEPDSVFWDAFGGGVVILPAMLIPSLTSPPAGLLLLVLGAVTASCVLMAGRHLESRRSRQSWRWPGYAEAEALHDALMARWSRYEIDPAQAIMYPAMTDVRIPQTAELIRAMRDAALSRAAAGARADAPAGARADAPAGARRVTGAVTGAVGGTVAGADYAAAVERFARALREAERAAGVPDNQ